MNKKYELLKDDCIEHEGKTLHRIKSLKDFRNIKAGDLGGYVESEKNLSNDGNCWIYNKAKVYDDAEVYGYANVCGNAIVSGNVVISKGTIIGDVSIPFKDIL